MRRAIVRRPGPNFQDGMTTADLGAPDYARALAQHDAYCEVLERCGLEVTRLEADPRYPDSTFVEDAAVLTKQCAILTRPGAASRIGEVGAVAEALSDFFASVETIHEPATLDGGDVCEAGNHYFVGISERTNEAGARQLSTLLGSLGHTCSLADIRDVRGLLHLKSGLAYLGDNRLAVVDGLAERKEFDTYERVRVNAGEESAANCVRINDYLLIAAGYPEFAATLGKTGYQTIQLEMTEFQKMDGGLSCLSLRF